MANYRIPKDAKRLLLDKRYVAHQTRGLTTNEAFRDLMIPTRCCTHLGGKRIFLRKKKKDGTLGWISLIDGGERCPNTAVASITVDGVAKRYCPGHFGIEHIPDEDEPND